MENTGYIKLHRSIQDSEIWFKPPEWFKIWNYILMEVNFKENGLPIGSARFTYTQIQEKCRVTRSTVDHFIRWAKVSDMISTKKATHLFIISVANYSQYQQVENEPKATPKATEKRQKSDRKAILYNKNGRMEEEIIISSKEDISQAIVVLENSEVPVIPEEYGKKEINLMQKFLRQSVGVSEFKDSRERWYVTHCYNLMKKIGKDEFGVRLYDILQDPFKQKNSNKLEYLYKELKAYIHSPVVQEKEIQKKVY